MRIGVDLRVDLKEDGSHATNCLRGVSGRHLSGNEGSARNAMWLLKVASRDSGILSFYVKTYAGWNFPLIKVQRTVSWNTLVPSNFTSPKSSHQRQ